MSNRLDKYRQRALEPKRIDYAIDALKSLGFDKLGIMNGNEIRFTYKGSVISLFPFTGWHTGKTIKDGRGINNLLKQLK